MDPRDIIDTLIRLVEFPSVSSISNANISEYVAERLRAIDFDVSQSQYADAQGTTKVNIVARRDPTQQPSAVRPGASATYSGGLAYFCHTDVVPVSDWTGPGGDPFRGVVHDDRVYGRGSCDMKGSLAAMLMAISQIDAARQIKPVWIVCTADEEVGFEGAKQLVEHSSMYREIVDHQPVGIIGEPTEMSVVHAHKGITGFRVTSQGRAAHSSTSDGVNATVAMVPMLQTLSDLLDRTESESHYQDERFDPPTLSWTFGVSSRDTAVNITPAHCQAWVTLRTMPEIDGEDLIQIAHQKADSLGLDFERIEGGGPVWVAREAPCIQEMSALTGTRPHTVCYGTDGGEFKELKQLVVCGPGAIAQAHTSDEWISTQQLYRGVDVYVKAIERWCCDG